MDLLGIPVGPVGWDVAGSELHTDDPFAISVDHRMEPIVGEHPTLEHPRPERTLDFDVGGVEHDDVTDEPRERPPRAVVPTR